MPSSAISTAKKWVRRPRCTTAERRSSTSGVVRSMRPARRTIRKTPCSWSFPPRRESRPSPWRCASSAVCCPTTRRCRRIGPSSPRTARVTPRWRNCCPINAACTRSTATSRSPKHSTGTRSRPVWPPPHLVGRSAPNTAITPSRTGGSPANWCVASTRRIEASARSFSRKSWPRLVASSGSACPSRRSRAFLR